MHSDWRSIVVKDFALVIEGAYSYQTKPVTVMGRCRWGFTEVDGYYIEIEDGICIAGNYATFAWLGPAQKLAVEDALETAFRKGYGHMTEEEEKEVEAASKLCLEIRTYERLAQKLAIYPGQGTLDGLLYATLGLVGEAGEFADKIKKILRDKDGVLDDTSTTALIVELGDVLWYMNACCAELGIEHNRLQTLSEENLKKLFDRYQRNALKGSGDNR